MAALFYTIGTMPDTPFFKNGFTINSSVSIPFIEKMINKEDAVIITEVVLQNRDTTQYFLTFNDLISFYYFGKGLGSMTISGLILGHYNGYGTYSTYEGVDTLMESIGKNFRGKRNSITFGNHGFWVVLSSYTFRASSEEHSINSVEFNLQFEVLGHTIPSPTFTAGC